MSNQDQVLTDDIRRGRPPTRQLSGRTQIVQFRLTKDERDSLGLTAKLNNVTVTEYLINTLAPILNQVHDIELEQPLRIVVNINDTQVILERDQAKYLLKQLVEKLII